MVVLPGWIILRVLRFRGSLTQWLVSIFGLSLVVNYAAVVLLTTAGLYQRGVVLFLFCVELGLLGWEYRSSFTVNLEQAASKTWQTLSGLRPDVSKQEGPFLPRFLYRLALIGLALLAISSLLWVVQVFYDNLGSVFNSWDAVVSWNRWAVSWAAGQFPSGSGHYPQLLSTNWSLSYVFMGSSQVQFFAKGIMPLFLFWILLMMFDLGWSNASAGAFLAVVLTRLVVKKFVGEFIPEGYSDIPVAFFGFLAVYTLLKLRQVKPEPGQVRLGLALGALFAGGAAVTKQAGVYILVLYPLLAYLLVLRQTDQLSRREKVTWILQALGLALCLVLPWYIYKQLAISLGKDMSEVAWVTNDIYQGVPVQERIWPALLSLEKYFYLLALLIPALLVMEGAYVWLVLLIVFPFTLSWAAYFSYDARNLTLIFPFLGLAVGMGVEGFLKRILDWLGRWRVERLRLLWLFLGLLAGFLGLLLWQLPDNTLVSRQIEKQKQIFNPELNQQLYKYFEKNKTDLKVLTNYPINQLPGLEGRAFEMSFNDFGAYKAALDKPEYGFLLVPNYALEDVQADIDQGIKAGKLKQVFKVDNYVPYRFIKIIR
jgi:hypothetical protein